MTMAPQDELSPDAIKDRKVIAWVESHLGGSVERCEKQSRWRGGWWVDVRIDGTLKNLYVREERTEEFPPWPLEHEAGVLQILEKHGVPAPHVYGICTDPHAIVMEALPGSTRFDPNQSEAERVCVLEHYAEVVAKMHAIDPHELVALGVKMPESADEIALGCYRLCEDMYLRGKKRPDPRIEFLRRWIERNIPQHRRKVGIVAVDSGQFLHKDGKVTGLFDFEYGCLGDPLIDLAFIPGRLGSEGSGDVRPFFKRYAEVSGDTLTIDVLTFHRVWWGLATPLITTANRDTPPAHGTYFEYIAWYVGPLMGAMLSLADLKDLKLDTQYEVPEPRPSRWAPMLDVMAARIPAPTPDDPYEHAEQRKYVQFLKRMDAQREVEAEYCEGIAALLGRPVRDWQEADAALEQFVLTAGPEHDDALIHLFYRWTLAQSTTLLDGINYMYYLHNPFPRFTDILA